MKFVLSVALSLVLVSSLPAQDTVQVKAGWNIIGSVKAGAIPDILSTDPPGLITTDFFGYEPGTGYQSLDTLKKGLGYWVKAGGDGIVVFESSPYTGCGVKRVEHEGISYGTVQIGNQCWLAENLNVGTFTPGILGQYDDPTTEKYCYNDDPVNCDLYGGLYQWGEAMQYAMTPGAQGICPAGWHIPTLDEFQTLALAVGGDGNALKLGGVGTGDVVGTNTAGFSGLFAGYRYNNDGSFNELNLEAALWSSSEIGIDDARTLYLHIYDSAVNFMDFHKSDGRSVRCIED